MRVLFLSLVLFAIAACSSSPQVTVVVPELTLWDSMPTGKDAAVSGKAKRGDVLTGQCGGFCQLAAGKGHSVWTYNTGLVPYPIAGTEMPLLSAASITAEFDREGVPAGAPVRQLAAGEKASIAHDLPGVPTSLTCVIEGGKVAGYIPRSAVEAAGGAPVVATTSTPAPRPCAESLAAFAPEGGEVLSRVPLEAVAESKEVEKLPDQELPCAASERDDDCRQIGVDWVFSKPREDGAVSDYVVKNLPDGRQSVVVRSMREKVTPAQGAGARLVWRPESGSADPLPADALKLGIRALEIGAPTEDGVRTYELRCPFQPTVAALPDTSRYCSKDEKVGVTLTIDTTAEKESFAARLISYKFSEKSKEERTRARSASLMLDLTGGLPLQLPADTSGPCDRPHYGIGGFHTFVPDAFALAKPAPIEVRYSAAEVQGLDLSTLAIYAWEGKRQDWKYVGGKHDPAARTVRAVVKELATYTLAPAMPVGKIELAATRAKGVHKIQTRPLKRSDGKPVKDGTLYTVLSVAPPDGAAVLAGASPFDSPLGKIVEADADPAEKGVQIAARGGKVAFRVQLDKGPATVVVYSVDGTALGVLSLP